MERKNKTCWNCGNYKAYYTKGLCHFDKLDNGLCKKQGKTVDKHDLCDLWRSNYKIRDLREEVAKRKLNEIMNSIVEIRQILIEEKEETKNDAIK